MKHLEIKLELKVPDIVQQALVKGLVAGIHKYFRGLDIKVNKLDVEVKDVK